jgi:PAS domain S-box-containing protein
MSEAPVNSNANASNEKPETETGDPVDRPGMRLALSAWTLVIGWTAIITLSLVWNLVQIRNQVNELARTEAETHLKRDQAVRFWVASHGGVYVPIDERTPPNPYLDHVPERDIQKPSGTRLTLMNPAYLLRQMNQEYGELYGVSGHLTSLDPLRPENSPDEWEAGVLEAFEEGAREVSQLTEIDGEPYLRLMRPMITKQACIKCHGQRGYDVGDVRGGMSVSVPMGPLWSTARKSVGPVAIGHVTLWLLALLGIGTWTRSMRRAASERHAVHEAREKALKTTNHLLQNLPFGLVVVDRDKWVRLANDAALRILGKTRDQVVGHRCWEGFTMTPECQCSILDLGKSVANSENICRGRDGEEIPVLKTVLSLTLDGEEMLLEAFVDLRDHKRAQDDLNRHVRELERFNRLAVDRELRMIELKREVNTLMVSLGRKERYKTHESEPSLREPTARTDSDSTNTHG